jgi:hypothetical protein
MFFLPISQQWLPHSYTQLRKLYTWLFISFFSGNYLLQKHCYMRRICKNMHNIITIKYLINLRTITLKYKLKTTVDYTKLD